MQQHNARTKGVEVGTNTSSSQGSKAKSVKGSGAGKPALVSGGVDGANVGRKTLLDGANARRKTLLGA
jgi:hypothetical protein